MKFLLHLVLLCSLCLDAPAQDAVTRLLDVLPNPTLEEVIESLGPAPPLEGLLAPSTQAPIMELLLAEADEARAQEQWRRASAQLASAELESARECGERTLELLSGGLSTDHPRVIDARLFVAELESIAARGNELRESSLASLVELKRVNSEVRGLASRVPLAEALIEYRAGADGTQSLGQKALGNLTILCYRAGAPVQAERLARAQLLECRAALGLCHPVTVTALSNLAYFLTARRDNLSAQLLYAHALDLRRQLDGTQNLGYARMLFNVAQSFRDGDRIAEAEQVFRRALALRVELQASEVEVGMTHSQLGYVLRRQGRHDEARQELQAALELFDAHLPPDHHERAQALQHLSVVERDTGRYEQAARRGRQVVEIYQRLYPDGHFSTAHALHSLAAIQLRRGELDEAERDVRSASGLFERVLPEEHAYCLESRATLASILRSKGDFAGARELLARNLIARRKVFGEQAQVIADDLSQLAALSFELGRHEQALEVVAEELEILRERVGAEHPRTISARVRRAEFLFHAGQLEQARAELGSLRALDSAVVPPLAAVGAALLEGRLQLVAGRTELACLAFEEALRELEQSDGQHPLVADVAIELGELHLALGEFELAAQILERAVAVAERLRARVLGDELDRAAYAGQLSLARASRGLVRAYASAGDAAAALAASERGRGRALLDLLGRSGRDLVAQAQARDPQAHAQLAQLLVAQDLARAELARSEELMRREHSRAKDAAWDASEQLERIELQRRALRERNAALARALSGVFPDSGVASTSEILDELGEDELLLHFSFDSRGVVLLTGVGSERGGLAAHVLASGVEEVERLRAGLRSLESQLRTGQVLDAEQLRALSNRLLPPEVARSLSAAVRVVVIPDGPLHGVPLEALMIGDERWIDVGPLCTYSPSGSVFARRARRAAPAREEAPRAVVLGAPEFGDAAQASTLLAARSSSELDAYRLFGSRLTPLHGSGVEALQVGVHLGASGFEVSTLLGDVATRAQLEQQARGATVLHLATHGFRAHPERPYEAALALSRPTDEGARDDGFLTLDELVREWGGALEGCELVTLSACDTNVGTLVGESVVSLYWGFFHAGAQSVLVSLWKVDDQATLLLMDRFYREWQGGALAKVEALAAARRWLASRTPAQNRARLEALGALAEDLAARSGGDGFPRPGADPQARPATQPYDFSHPRHWAAFVLFGSPD